MEGIVRGWPEILNMILATLKAPWRKRLFLVGEIFRMIFRNHQTIHMQSNVWEIT